MKKVMLAIPFLCGGGAERVVSVWANELAEKGFETYVLVCGRVENEYEITEKVNVLSVAPTYKEYTSMSSVGKIRAMRKIVKSVRPDYIIPFIQHIQIWMLFACAGLGIKRIETVRANPWILDKKSGKMAPLWNFCFKTSHAVILQSKDQQPFFSEKIQKKCVIIPNPISSVYINVFKEGAPEKISRFLAAGRITAQKNYKMMIDAFIGALKTNPDISLDIYGGTEGDEGERISRYIAEKNVEEKIRLMGRAPKMQEVYKNYDAFLMSSDFEGMPNALAEAMASRLICISTDCKTGPRDLIDDGKNGYLVPTDDAKSMTAAINCVMSLSRDERAAMADAAREKILSYCSRENSVGGIVDILCR